MDSNHLFIQIILDQGAWRGIGTKTPKGSTAVSHQCFFGGRSVGKNGVGTVEGEAGSVSGGDGKADGVRSSLSVGFAGVSGRQEQEKSESTLPLYSGRSVVDGRVADVKEVVCTEVVGEDVSLGSLLWSEGG
jgi:hypothetical protein